MRKFFKFVIASLFLFFSTNSAAGKKATKLDLTLADLGSQFLYSVNYLLSNSPHIGFFDHLEAGTFLALECGAKNDIEPLIGAVIGWHESRGDHGIQAKKTGDTGFMQIKPKYAFKPENYEMYKFLAKMANISTKKTIKADYEKRAKLAYKKLYSDKYSVKELQNISTNIKVGCWALAKWRYEWHGKSPDSYISKYAVGSKVTSRAQGFQKWVLGQVNKTKRRLDKKSLGAVIGNTMSLAVQNTVDQLSDEKKKMLAGLDKWWEIMTKWPRLLAQATPAKPVYDDLLSLLQQDK